MEKKIKHLEMILDVVNRMASNSFALKGWAVTLVAGIFALQGNETSDFRYAIAFVPIIIFWGLDAYYLSRERAYRSLYKYVSALDETNIDFDMDISISTCQSDKNKFWNCVKSPTELFFYLPLLILVVVIILITAFYGTSCTP